MTGEYDTAELSSQKRAAIPDEWGDECPACGDRYDVGSSGFFIAGSSTECMSWVRICVDDAPEYAPDAEQFVYVHKDEHI